ncbi:MAG: protein kinase domain-containing protein [Streptosporangiaceae bacterium]
MSLLAGRYELHARIGVGGYGEVWRGLDSVLARPVAIKLLQAEHAVQPEAMQRFRAEARHAGAISHPCIAHVYDYCEPAPPDPPFLVMELVDGPSLAELLSRGPLDVARAMDVISQAAAGLHAAHQAGVVHRDIKPGNLLVGRSGPVKLTDFGIAQPLVPGNSGPVTMTGMVLGTAGYLAPERVEGDQATVATDLYALGVVAHECLAGLLPRHGTPVRVGGTRVDGGGRVAGGARVDGTARAGGGTRVDSQSSGHGGSGRRGGTHAYSDTGETGGGYRGGETGGGVPLAPRSHPLPPLPADVPPGVAELVARLTARDPARRPATAGEVARLAAELSGQVWTASAGSQGRAATVSAVGPGPRPVVPGPREAFAGPRQPGPAARRPASRGRSRTAAAAAIATVAGLGLLAFGVAAAMNHSSPPPVHITQPSASSPADVVDLHAGSLVGQQVAAVRPMLRQEGLVVQVVVRESGLPAGEVLAVTPSGVVPVGSVVKLTVAGPIVVPSQIPSPGRRPQPSSSAPVFPFKPTKSPSASPDPSPATSRSPSGSPSPSSPPASSTSPPTSPSASPIGH